MNSLRITLLFTFMILVAYVSEALSESSGEEFELEIPEQCKSLGLCDNIPNYPTEQAKKIIQELKDSGEYYEGKLPLPTTNLPTKPEVTRRVEPFEDKLVLCKSELKTIHPQAGVDLDGKWHAVLNLDDDQIQQFTVEICSENLAPCAAYIVFRPGCQGVCKQTFYYDYMWVLDPGGIRSKKRLRLPASCSCSVQRNL